MDLVELTRPVWVDDLNQYLSIATLIGAAAVVIIAGLLGFITFKDNQNPIITFLGKYVFPIGFFASLFGTFLTLYYEYGLHYPPCDLCWFQRIFLYPQLFMFAYAWWKKDRAILPYSLILSLIGVVVALYHHLLQMGYDLYKPCSDAPFAVSCSKPSFIEFGFVSFPFMAIVLFAFMSVVAAAAIQYKNNK